jgi:uncharacterized protein YbjT (DUF2867 family)
MPRVFISGGTGYLGLELIGELLRRRFEVCALARPGSESKLPAGCDFALGNAMDPASYAPNLRAGDTVVHLVGVSHPNPWKGEEFQRVDVASVRAALPSAAAVGVTHFIYVSVAHPAPMMKAYIAARTACEEMIRDARLNATILRPWYVLGPGHRWPYLLIPFYKLLESMASKRESALRLGLVTRKQMVSALVWAVENPARGIRIVEVPEIRRAG